MFEAILFSFVVMLADVVVTIPMIIVGAVMRWKTMLVVAFVGALLVQLTMSGVSSGAQGIEGFAARLLAMTFAGLVGTAIYKHRMKKRVKQSQLKLSPPQADASA